LPIFVNRTRPSVAAVCLVLLAACGSGGTRPPATAAASAVPPAAGTTAGTAVVAATARGAVAEPEPAGAGPAESLVPEAASRAHLAALDAMAAGDYAAAIDALEQVVMEYPSYPGPLVNLAIAYRQQGRDADAAIALEQALALDPGHPAANNESGILSREHGDFAAAEAAYRRAIAADPGYALAHYNLGVLLDIYLQRRDEALRQYEIYQGLAEQPDPNVDFWVVDLRRRLGLPAERPVRLAQEDSE